MNSRCPPEFEIWPEHEEPERKSGKTGGDNQRAGGRLVIQGWGSVGCSQLQAVVQGMEGGDVEEKAVEKGSRENGDQGVGETMCVYVM